MKSLFAIGIAEGVVWTLFLVGEITPLDMMSPEWITRITNFGALAVILWLTWYNMARYQPRQDNLHREERAADSKGHREEREKLELERIRERDESRKDFLAAFAAGAVREADERKESGLHHERNMKTMTEGIRQANEIMMQRLAELTRMRDELQRKVKE